MMCERGMADDLIFSISGIRRIATTCELRLVSFIDMNQYNGAFFSSKGVCLNSATASINIHLGYRGSHRSLVHPTVLDAIPEVGAHGTVGRFQKDGL